MPKRISGPIILHVPDRAALSLYSIPLCPTDARRKLEPAIVPFQLVEPVVPMRVTNAYVPTAPAVLVAVLERTQLFSLPPVANFCAVTLLLAILSVVTVPFRNLLP